MLYIEAGSRCTSMNWPGLSWHETNWVNWMRICLRCWFILKSLMFLVIHWHQFPINHSLHQGLFFTNSNILFYNSNILCSTIKIFSILYFSSLSNLFSMNKFYWFYTDETWILRPYWNFLLFYLYLTVWNDWM